MGCACMKCLLRPKQKYTVQIEWKDGGKEWVMEAGREDRG